MNSKAKPDAAEATEKFAYGLTEIWPGAQWYKPPKDSDLSEGNENNRLGDQGWAGLGEQPGHDKVPKNQDLVRWE